MGSLYFSKMADTSKCSEKKTRNAAAYEALNVKSLTCNFFLDANI